MSESEKPLYRGRTTIPKVTIDKDDFGSGPTPVPKIVEPALRSGSPPRNRVDKGLSGRCNHGATRRDRPERPSKNPPTTRHETVRGVLGARDRIFAPCPAPRNSLASAASAGFAT